MRSVAWGSAGKIRGRKPPLEFSYLSRRLCDDTSKSAGGMGASVFETTRGRAAATLRRLDFSVAISLQCQPKLFTIELLHRVSSYFLILSVPARKAPANFRPGHCNHESSGQKAGVLLRAHGAMVGHQCIADGQDERLCLFSCQLWHWFAKLSCVVHRYKGAHKFE